MNNVLKRTTLIVRDAERSLAFYRDVLGRLGLLQFTFVMQTDDVDAVCQRLAA